MRRVVARRRRGGRRIGDLYQGLLGRADVPEQAHRIERRMLRVQRVVQRLRRARIGDEALVRRQRCVIALADQRAFARLLGLMTVSGVNAITEHATV